MSENTENSAEAMLERIAEHREAIVALLKARRAASHIDWLKLSDISADEYGALVEAIKSDVVALQGALDRLERAGGTIIPRMRENACSWRDAVQSLLNERYNLRFEHRRPKHVSDEDWLAALMSAVALLSLTMLFFVRMQPPTVIRIGPTGEAVVLGKPGAGAQNNFAATGTDAFLEGGRLLEGLARSSGRGLP